MAAALVLFLPPLVLVFFAAFNLSGNLVTASPTDHRYNVGDRIPLYVNKVGPLNNPSVVYQYYEIPFCTPDPVTDSKASLGELLSGVHLMNALYELKFREDKYETILCRKKLNKYEISKFRDAIIGDFYFQMYGDDLPIWGYIGKVDDYTWSDDAQGPKYYLFNHVQFEAVYNGDQVIELHAFSDPHHVVDLTRDDEVVVEFTYSVAWNETSVQFKNRMDRYTRASLLPVNKQIHRFAFINLVVIVVLLAGLILVIYMRHLKNYLRRPCGGNELEDNEAGWKYFHGDVFRCPSSIFLFCAFLGSGCQLLTMVCSLFLLAFLGILYPYSRGSLSTSLVVIYTITSAVAGYSAASFYCQFAEIERKKMVFLSGMLYLGPVVFTLCILNIVALTSGATFMLSIGTAVVIFLVYILVFVPLHALGASIGCLYSSKFEEASATKKCQREMPTSVWYRKTPYQMFLGGFLPFSAVVLELHQLYASIWGYKICALPIILFGFFVILVMLTAVLSVVLTYFQLTMEGHQWWWRSFLCGGSTAIFMFCHGLYFYARSNMSGYMQLAFFLGYNACLCYAIFLILGAIGFYASFVFVRHVHRAVKSE